MAQETREQFEAAKMKTLRSLIEKMGPQLAAALPRHIPQERFLRVMLTTIRRDRKGTLMDCSTMSIIGAMMEAAQDGLELDGVHAALVPYKDHGQLNAHYMKMYRGLIAMARRSGDVSGVTANPVYEGELWQYEEGLNPILRHVPGDCDDPEKILRFYCIVSLKDGTKLVKVMSRDKVNAIRDGSKGYQFDPNGSPWTSDYAEMGCKTVARRALKWAPMAAEDQRSIARDELVERGQMAALSGIDEPLALPAGVDRDPMPDMAGEGDGERQPAAKASSLADRIRSGKRPGVGVSVAKPGPGDKAGPVHPRAEEPPNDDGPPPAGDADGVIGGA